MSLTHRSSNITRMYKSVGCSVVFESSHGHIDDRDDGTRLYSKILSKAILMASKILRLRSESIFLRVHCVVLDDEKYHLIGSVQADLALSIQLIIETAEKQLGSLD